VWNGGLSSTLSDYERPPSPGMNARAEEGIATGFRDTLSFFIIGMARHINDHSARQQEDGVLVVGDIYAVAVAPSQPLLRYGSHGPVATPKDVLEIQKVTLGDQVVWAGDVNSEGASEKSEELLCNHGRQGAVSVDFVSRAPREELLLDIGELVALHVLKGQLISKSQGLAVYEESVPAGTVLNDEIIAPCKELLLHSILHSSHLLHVGIRPPPRWLQGFSGALERNAATMARGKVTT